MAQQVAQNIQQQAHDQIAGVVTRCLQAVFDDSYEFHIDFERKRGRTEAQLYFSRNGNRLDPMSASGGGCVDLASFT
ncbi:MAG: ATPase, partial [Candidatus Marinimicrobia bacterium]|nr:ATPase [Candidatus Neomarinimicrobiota bacterium]